MRGLNPYCAGSRSLTHPQRCMPVLVQSLNPYCAGSRSLTKYWIKIDAASSCLNPYCAGSRSLTDESSDYPHINSMVLILVVVEVGL